MTSTGSEKGFWSLKRMIIGNICDHLFLVTAFLFFFSYSSIFQHASAAIFIVFPLKLSLCHIKNITSGWHIPIFWTYERKPLARHLLSHFKATFVGKHDSCCEAICIFVVQIYLYNDVWVFTSLVFTKMAYYCHGLCRWLNGFVYHDCFLQYETGHSSTGVWKKNI